MYKDPTPLELAFALAQLEADRYRNILPSECIALATNQLLSCPNLLFSAIDLNKQAVMSQSSVSSLLT